MLIHLKLFLYKILQRIYLLPRQIFKNIFWEDNVDNLYYGHYNILKHYSGTFFPYKINGELQHGWAPHSGITSLDAESKNKSLKLSRYYLFNSNNKEQSINGGYLNVIRIGAPFLYIKDPKQFYLPIIKNSLILFPTHTHEYAGLKDPIQVYKQYIHELKKISHNFSLITVSLGWTISTSENKNQIVVGTGQMLNFKIIEISF